MTEHLPPAATSQLVIPVALVAREHLALIRQLARLQQQMTLLVRSHDTQLRHWQRQLMRQSVRLLLERSRADWGLVPSAWQALSAMSNAQESRANLSDPSLVQALATAQTDALICRTGCQMDGDHWRDGELCKRNGQACAAGLPATDTSEI